MTWTGTEAPLVADADADADGAGGGGGWAPLAPGALGADPVTASAAATLVEEPPALPLAGPLADALHAARVALDDAVLAARHLATTGPEQRLQALQQIGEARHVADAVVLHLIASFAAEEVRALGATSLTDLAITHTGTDPRRAASEVRLAAALTAPPAQPAPPAEEDDDGDGGGEGAASPGGPAAASSAVSLGLLGAAHAEGRVSTDVAALAQRTIADLPARVRRAHGAEADALLAETLPGLTHPQARIACDTLAHGLDPDRADGPFDPDDVERRRADTTVHGDGWVDVHARLDPVAGAAFKAALDHASKPDPTAAAALAPGGDDGFDGSGDGDGDGRQASVPVRDPRSATQRRADALAALVRAGAADTGTRGGEPARVIVTTTDDALRGVPGAQPAHCESTGRSLTRAQLLTLACSASLQAVRLSCGGADAAALSLGRAVRLFSAAQRRAMLARDGGCVIPGCTAPPGWLEAHHVLEWAAGGPTDVASGVLVCTRHHVLVTLGVWEVRMVDGVPHVRPPRTVDPLRRWLLNPRRALRDATARRAEQLLLDPPDGWRDDPPDLAGSAGETHLAVPDIPSPHGTCGC